MIFGLSVLNIPFGIEIAFSIEIGYGPNTLLHCFHSGVCNLFLFGHRSC